MLWRMDRRSSSLVRLAERIISCITCCVLARIMTVVREMNTIALTSRSRQKSLKASELANAHGCFLVLR